MRVPFAFSKFPTLSLPCPHHRPAILTERPCRNRIALAARRHGAKRAKWSVSYRAEAGFFGGSAGGRGLERGGWAWAARVVQAPGTITNSCSVDRRPARPAGGGDWGISHPPSLKHRKRWVVGYRAGQNSAAARAAGRELCGSWPARWAAITSAADVWLTAIVLHKSRTC